MCRWMAYRGAPLLTSELLLHPVHSIVAQSLSSSLGAETVNGDGFGLGWYPERGGAPGTYHSIAPAWNDANLRSLAGATYSPLFFAHVRAAAGPPIQETNCHPFSHDGWMFMHNGYIHGFAAAKRDLVLRIDPTLYADILGTTDTEVLFHLALTHGLRDDPVGALSAAIADVERIGRCTGARFPFQGTVAVTDGTTVWALRYSTEGRSRSLFHSAEVAHLRALYPDEQRLDLFSDDAQLVVSEPLTDLPGVFLEVPESTVVVLDPEGYRYLPFTPSEA
jgi:glutamine amidotransferase